MPNLTETYIVVEGADIFPMDMLRYDTCYPHSETDSRKLDADVRDKRRVLIVHRGTSKQGKLPTCKRWESFGWCVLHFGTDAAEALEIMHQQVGTKYALGTK